MSINGKYVYNITIDTMADARKLVDIATKISDKVLLQSGEKFRVNAKSFLGVVLAKKLNSTIVGYVIAPRINAAGRITSAHRAAELLLSEEKSEAKKIIANHFASNAQFFVTKINHGTKNVSTLHY